MRCICCLKPSVECANDVRITPTKIVEGPITEEEDSRIPLTKKQKYVLTKNWKGIAREVSVAGVEMFLK
ncbi:unnamed protein product [Gongylonema pulchrum]|uniref:Uncharacterized protein n=1 Tax=Gongylonema pulchrum TaxID=637853 RepID=A0A183E590_9BILA|nr:unnamed protein product [Gongylonema pulchrum]